MTPQAYPAKVLDDLANPTMMSFLDMARWLAASMVLLGHLRNPLFLGFKSVPAADRSIAANIWYFITGFHAEAVIVFFVLSGFLVGGAAAGRVARGNFDLTAYFIDRFTRIYIPFLPALLLTAALDLSGSSWFASSGFYTHQHPMILEKVSTAPFVTYMTTEIFGMNALLQQFIHAPAFGSNQPLWTISLEFWFYVVFGLAILAFAYRQNALRVAGAVLLVLLAVFLGAGFFVYFGLWLVGLAVAFVPRLRLGHPLLALGAFLLLLICIRLFGTSVKENELTRTLKDFLVAIVFAGVVVSMRQFNSMILKRLANINAFMASFSYSLYLIHFPLMLFLLGALFSTGRFPSIGTGYSPAQIEGWLVYAGVALACFACAWAFSQLTEQQTGKARRWLKQRIDWRPSTSAKLS